MANKVNEPDELNELCAANVFDAKRKLELREAM
jgi:hypothetical protein